MALDEWRAAAQRHWPDTYERFEASVRCGVAAWEDIRRRNMYMCEPRQRDRRVDVQRRPAPVVPAWPAPHGPASARVVRRHATPPTLAMPATLATLAVPAMPAVPAPVTPAPPPPRLYAARGHRMLDAIGAPPPKRRRATRDFVREAEPPPWSGLPGWLLDVRLADPRAYDAGLDQLRVAQLHVEQLRVASGQLNKSHRP
jgi:hypothetical protein